MASVGKGGGSGKEKAPLGTSIANTIACPFALVNAPNGD